jgi:hypothetical protein
MILFCSHLFYILFVPKPLVLFKKIANLKLFKFMQFYCKPNQFLVSKQKKKNRFQKKIRIRPRGTESARALKPAQPAKDTRPKRYAAHRAEVLTGKARLSAATSRQRPAQTR